MAVIVCEKPVWVRSQAFPCNDCEPCRINRRRVWTNRLMMENLKHSHSCFVTLTYDQRHLPPNGTLIPDHMSLWLRKLREKIAPRRLRFYGCGEYGEQSERPHYHLVVFGVSYLEDQVMRDCWSHGFVKVGSVTPESCSYVAGYVVKKIRKSGDPGLLGRYPEFSRMSLKPGIGAPAVADITNSLMTAAGLKAVFDHKSVPDVLTHGKRTLPNGRYIKAKLKEEYEKQTGEILPKAQPETPKGVLRVREENQPVTWAKRRPKDIATSADEKIGKALKRKERFSKSRRTL